MGNRGEQMPMSKMLNVPPLTAAEKHAAALTVCERTPDRADARLFLAMLDLLPEES